VKSVSRTIKILPNFDFGSWQIVLATLVLNLKVNNVKKCERFSAVQGVLRYEKCTHPPPFLT